MLGDSIKMKLRETGYEESYWIKSRAQKLTRMNKPKGSYLAKVDSVPRT
jgi:hypothetical protein